MKERIEKTVLIAGALVSLAVSGCVSISPESNGNVVKAYPLQTCLVDGDQLGSMGEPITIVHEGQELKFCCQACVKKFRANPQPYLSKLGLGNSEGDDLNSGGSGRDLFGLRQAIGL